MPRIRTVKPEFFRHEKLQELGPLSMLIFEGLWTQCDKAGRFPWKPRTLKLDILPFLTFDMESELGKLSDAFFVIKYEAEGEFFGVIPTFGEHQRVSGKEALEPAKYPTPPTPKPKKTRRLPPSEARSAGEALVKQPGSAGDGQESQEGNGVQERSTGNGNGTEGAAHLWFSDPGFSEAWDGWKEMRKKKDPLTARAEKLNFTTLQKLTADLPEAIAIVNKTTEKSWSGFFPLKEENGNNRNPQAAAGRSGKAVREFTERLTL